jgi:hypothetical protein
MADPLERFTKPPVEASDQNTVTVGTPPATETLTPSTETSTPTNQTAQAQPQTPTPKSKPDEFIENFNKRFSTPFKNDDDIKNILGLQQKIVEYEGKAKLSESQTKEIEDYKKQIENFKNSTNGAELLEKPLLRKAYIADQLLAKYPDKDPYTLQEIVMSDVSKMSDIDVLVKAQKINHPNIAENDLRAAIYKKNGIDPDIKPEDWDSVTRAELAMSADDARATLKTLTSGIEFPKAATKEQRDADEVIALQKRIQATDPLKAEFTTFDKFKSEKGKIDYDVPADFKAKLPDMFQAMFVDAGLDPTPENKATAMELRDMTFLYQNIDKIIEVKVKEGQTEIQRKLDEALNNTTPPNTKTATDEGSPQDNRRGLGAFLEDMKH